MTHEMFPMGLLIPFILSSDKFQYSPFYYYMLKSSIYLNVINQFKVLHSIFLVTDTLLRAKCFSLTLEAF